VEKEKMKNVRENEITYQELTSIIVGTVLGVGIFGLPNRLAEISKQDCWISAALGGVYPLYIVLMCILISKKYPQDNILSVSKNVFGNFLGSILNLLYTSVFFVNLISLTSGVMSLSRIYIVPFLSAAKVSIILLLLAVYGVFLGLKVIGRISEFMYYLTVFLLTLPLIALNFGSILNICPIFGSGMGNILKASLESCFSYSGIEILLLIYPNVKEKGNLSMPALKAVLVIMLIYTNLTFLTLYLLGPDLILKPYFPVMLLNEIVKLPYLNSFRFFFMYLWIMVTFKTVINYYYALTFSISNSTIKLNLKRTALILFPVIFVAVNSIRNETRRRTFIKMTSYPAAAFNILFVTLIAMVIFFKKGEKNENL
jgi:spore germination protein (amino acid permease)